jgi:transcription-repair coupling factor (superfamily II helicase)
MAEFPLHIAKLSRFGTLAEQREVVRGMASGSVDIVIGTHRLASKDIRFDNLGLVIIDEEQRFGVDVKERLKTLRSSVDVLTMTATPIPRTLHMSLVGVRDISNLETPPQERVAVETKVTRWTNEVIRHAVIRELNRGGQIYFVHNRVQDIHVVATKLRQIVPEVRIGIAHGQLPEDELECVMVDFLQHEIDLLLATTIVESGLDIPNANTIFIDEADCYGLADLHQLRGRVGRSSHRAYCYLLLDPRKSITPQATKRLHAIEEFSEMGAGFAISMRDLEIRGAGNLLGNEQSGHIAAVGYELYCQLLEDAVRQQRRLPPKLTMDVEINLPVRAFLPDEFVGDMRLKIDLYRRLSRVSSDAELTEFFQELQDRFGPLPPPVEGLRQLAEIRLDAAFWQISTIFVEDHLLGLHFSDRQRLKVLGQQSGHTFRVVDGQTAYVPLPGESLSDDGLVWFAKSVLRAS